MKLKLLLCSVLLINGCSSSTPVAPTIPIPPNSPQTQAVNITKTLADSINAAVNTAISLRGSGKLSAANTTLIENWASSAAKLDDSIATELSSSDTWAVQEQKILVLIPTFKIPGTSTLDVSMQAAISAVSALLNQLQAQVSQ